MLAKLSFNKFIDIYWHFSSYNIFMTIYALSSGPGISGVAVIRISGEKTKDVIKQITGRKLPKPRMASLNKIWPKLSSIKSGANTQVLFLSVDPKRDTFQRLKSYISFFNKDFIAATGPHAEIFPLVRNMGLMYSLTEDTDKADYLVDHSASVVLISPEAEVLGRFKPIMEPGKLAIIDSEQILADMPKVVITR